MGRDRQRPKLSGDQRDLLDHRDKREKLESPCSVLSLSLTGPLGSLSVPHEFLHTGIRPRCL